MTFDIISLGEILVDFTIDEKNNYKKNPGGAPLNVAATLSKFNLKAGFIGKIGNDECGGYLKKVLTDLKIDTTNLIIDKDHLTTQVFITTNKEGERFFSFKRDNTADLFLNKKEILLEQLKSTKVFHFGSLSLVNKTYEDATLSCLIEAKNNNALISFDPNYREALWKNKQIAIKKIIKYLPYVDILKLSYDEALFITKKETIIDAFKFLTKYNIPIILITNGKNGAMFQYKKCIGNVKADKVEAIDTTGAGDIFLGTFLTMLIKYNKNFNNLKYNDLLAYTKKACKSATQSTLKKGAIPSIPDYIS